MMTLRQQLQNMPWFFRAISIFIAMMLTGTVGTLVERHMLWGALFFILVTLGLCFLAFYRKEAEKQE